MAIPGKRDSSMADSSPTEVKRDAKVSLAVFLETSPPDTRVHVHDVAALNSQATLVLNEGDVRLPCDSEECEGKGRLGFEQIGTSYLKHGSANFVFATYFCRNCRMTTKTYALGVFLEDKGSSGIVQKFGEVPAFGSDVPARVITLIGPDRDLFLSGRRAENRGLGIGAFAYYRRVVENQKGRIVEEMAKVAKKARFVAAGFETIRGRREGDTVRYGHRYDKGGHPR